MEAARKKISPKGRVKETKYGWKLELDEDLRIELLLDEWFRFQTNGEVI